MAERARTLGCGLALGSNAGELARGLEAGCTLRVTFVLRTAAGAATLRTADGAAVTQVPRVTFVKQRPPRNPRCCT